MNNENNPAWEGEKKIIENKKTIRFKIYENSRCLTCFEFVDLLSGDNSFRYFFNNLLACSDFTGYFFECIPFDKNWKKSAFEFVLIYNSVFN